MYTFYPYKIVIYTCSSYCFFTLKIYLGNQVPSVCICLIHFSRRFFVCLYWTLVDLEGPYQWIFKLDLVLFCTHTHAHTIAALNTMIYTVLYVGTLSTTHQNSLWSYALARELSRNLHSVCILPTSRLFISGSIHFSPDHFPDSSLALPQTILETAAKLQNC